MPDRLEYIGKWICPKCRELIEETDPDLLGARIQMHKCKKEKKDARQNVKK